MAGVRSGALQVGCSDDTAARVVKRLQGIQQLRRRRCLLVGLGYAALQRLEVERGSCRRSHVREFRLRGAEAQRPQHSAELGRRNLRAAADDECAQSAPAASPPLSEEANDDVDEFLAPSARVVDEDRDAVSNRSSPASSDDPLILPDDGDYGRRSEDQLIVFEPPIVASY